jgi:hypothetical protein
MNLKYSCFLIFFVPCIAVSQDVISVKDVIGIKYVSDSYFTSSSPNRTIWDLAYRLETSAPAACSVDIYDEKSIERICKEYNRYSGRISIDSVRTQDFIGVRGCVLILMKDSSTNYIAILGSWSPNISVNGNLFVNDNRILRVLRKSLNGNCKRELSRLIRRNNKKRI